MSGVGVPLNPGKNNELMTISFKLEDSKVTLLAPRVWWPSEYLSLAVSHVVSTK